MLESTTISLHTGVTASAEQVSCEVAGEALILNLKDGIYYTLNEVGTKVWAMLRERRTAAELCGALLREYPDVPPERCERDVLALLCRMGEWGLVEVSSAA